MKKPFFSEILYESRFLQVLYDNLPQNIKTSKLYNEVKFYIEKYCIFNNISAKNAVNFYSHFISNFNKHCKHFIKSGEYPALKNFGDLNINREEYDIVLLMSVLFTYHRFRIMQLIVRKELNDKALFIGLGPGLEVSLTRGNYNEIHAYDLLINKFIFSEFSDLFIKQELYWGQNPDYFDSIYMIELLEHLYDPLELLKICYKSLIKNGKIYFTTATDIPQFDHIYNFPLNHTKFEIQVNKIGFCLIYKEMILHNYLTQRSTGCNHFYIFEKV